MARPPVEWPIPTYVVEYRERLLITVRVPGRALAAVAAPILPELVQGQGLITLSLANGRCLKTVGGAPVLAAEFHTAELLTPVRRQGACRAAQRGLFLLRFLADSHGLCRLIRTALRCEAEHSLHSQGAEKDGYRCHVEPEEGTALRLATARPRDAAPWPESSLFPAQEQAEAALLRPEWFFAPDLSRQVVRAVPIHHYARSTHPVALSDFDGGLVAESLGLDAAELTLDHAVIQKRCTHTWMFPPERILTARAPVRPLTAPRASLPPLGAGHPPGATEAFRYAGS